MAKHILRFTLLALLLPLISIPAAENPTPHGDNGTVSWHIWKCCFNFNPMRPIEGEFKWTSTTLLIKTNDSETTGYDATITVRNDAGELKRYNAYQRRLHLEPAQFTSITFPISSGEIVSVEIIEQHAGRSNEFLTLSAYNGPVSWIGGVEVAGKNPKFPVIVHPHAVVISR